MNDPSQPLSDITGPGESDELEARVVAMVLGEASEFERAQLVAAIESNAALKAFYDELRSLHQSMPGAASKEALPDEWRLPAEKRAELLHTIEKSSAGQDEEVMFEPLSSRENLRSGYFQRRILAGIIAAAAGVLIVGSVAVVGWQVTRISNVAVSTGQVAQQSRDAAKDSSFFAESAIEEEVELAAPAAMPAPVMPGAPSTPSRVPWGDTDSDFVGPFGDANGRDSGIWVEANVADDPFASPVPESAVTAGDVITEDRPSSRPSIVENRKGRGMRSAGQAMAGESFGMDEFDGEGFGVGSFSGGMGGGMGGGTSGSTRRGVLGGKPFSGRGSVDGVATPSEQDESRLADSIEDRENILGDSRAYLGWSGLEQGEQQIGASQQTAPVSPPFAFDDRYTRDFSGRNEFQYGVPTPTTEPQRPLATRGIRPRFDSGVVTSDLKKSAAERMPPGGSEGEPRNAPSDYGRGNLNTRSLIEQNAAKENAGKQDFADKQEAAKTRGLRRSLSEQRDFALGREVEARLRETTEGEVAQSEFEPNVVAGGVVEIEELRGLDRVSTPRLRLSQTEESQLKSQRTQNAAPRTVLNRQSRREFLRRSKETMVVNEKNALEEPFSTFSLHVSDVSFKLAQNSLANGIWPDPAKVRVEEFVNAFDYRDPTPPQEEKVACQVEQAIHPFMQQRNLLRISMRTAAAGRAAQTPLRLTCLLDNSGSMERIDRQDTVRKAFATLAEQLHPNDAITLISFANQPRLLADRVPGERAGELVSMIDQLPSEGGTNIESALQLAFEKAQEQQSENAQNRIVLLTDGAVNLGDADPANLASMITQIRDNGIAFDAAGIIADGLNDEVLESMTRKGDGRYYLLDSIESADASFAKQIAGALRPSAKNVKVQVEFNPDRVGNYRLLGFEKHRLKKEDFRNDSVDAAEMAAEEAGVAVYEIEAKPDGEGDVGSVSVRYRDLSTGLMVENRWPIPVSRRCSAS